VLPLLFDLHLEGVDGVLPLGRVADHLDLEVADRGVVRRLDAV
jgi:hypothetical protein